MRFDCLLITRPRAEADDLAGRLGDLDLPVVIQPAFRFTAVKMAAAEFQALQRAAMAEPPPLLIFTSTRAVEFALPQLPFQLLQACRLAAIGPATAAALQQAGLHSILQADAGYTSEDLLRSLGEAGIHPAQAWIINAAGGRQTLLQGLQQDRVDARELHVYERQPAAVAAANNDRLQQSVQILSVWTSANSMKQLASGLSAAGWRQVCAGEWLVVSPRLAELAAEFQPAAVQVSAAPGNAELAHWVRKRCRQD